MNKQPWDDFVPDYLSFGYFIKVPVTSSDYQEKIPEFVNGLLKAGWETKIYYYPIEGEEYSHFINNWAVKLKKHLASPRVEKFGLFDHFLIPHSAIEIRPSTEVRFPEGLLAWPPKGDEDSRPLVEVDNFGFVDLPEEKNWQVELEVELVSKSNIWFEEIEIGIVPGSGKRARLLDVIRDNSETARQIVPRFNQFIQRMRELVESLGGTLTLEETWYSDNVKQDGIVLEG